MNEVRFPEGYLLEQLRRGHSRKPFDSGEPAVNDWLMKNALQQQEKHLSNTAALLNEKGAIAGYYTLATGQMDFGDLPPDLTKHLPRRILPVALLAWLGVTVAHHGEGLGRLLLVRALRDCFEGGKTFAFVAVILDCLNDGAKAFYQRWNFEELPGNPYRLFLSTQRLETMMEPS